MTSHPHTEAPARQPEHPQRAIAADGNSGAADIYTSPVNATWKGGKS
jgi:hypothetical protein